MNNERFNKIVAELKFAGEYAAICGGAYMLGGADMALAFVRKLRRRSWARLSAARSA